MLRTIDYRHAVNAFVFTGLWFVIGAVALWSPLPGALGIGGEMFAAWVILFFLIMAVAGSLLTVAALNAAFPPQPAGTAPPRGRTIPARSTTTPLWAPPQTTAPSSPSQHGATQRRDG